MDRRLFIKQTILVSGGIILSQALLNCTSDGIPLKDLIGKPESTLNQEAKNGYDIFSYYLLSNSDYIHPVFRGEEVVVYCENQKIIGYTIQIKETRNFELYKTNLSKKNGSTKKTYNNDFGESYQWKTNNRKLTLEITKDVPGVTSNIFFSESLLNNKLIVF